MRAHQQDAAPEAVLEFAHAMLPHLERLARRHGIKNPAHYLRMAIMQGEIEMNVRPSVEDIPDRPVDHMVESAITAIAVMAGDEASRLRDEAEMIHQRHMDEAMADTVELVRRNRARLNRRVTSPSDGRIIRQIFALLRNMSNDDSKTTFGADT